VPRPILDDEVDQLDIEEAAYSPLKKQCEKDGISTCWGLEMMLLL